ncbi:MAG: hypothetical protein H8D67_14820 [Deltaproteobacteria bacterium]|nr:hypothetical protein [Deltaproteobacteria bacterium]
MSIIEEKYVIQHQQIQWLDWYDSYRVTASLSEAKALLRSGEFVESKNQGVRYRIVKRTTYEEVVE